MLNDLWIGTYKLRANLSKFERDKTAQQKQTGRVESENFIHNQAWRREGTSFVEVMTGRKHENESLEQRNIEKQKQNFVGLCYKSNEELRNYLKHCFTRCLKEEFQWFEIGKLIKELCGDSVNVSHLGGELVLFRSRNQDKLKLEDLEGFLEWFEFIRPWSEDDISNMRVVWTKWFGVPLHAWKPKIFNIVATKFGKSLKIDADIESKENLQYARVLLRTPYLKISKKVFPIEIDGKIFYINVREEEDLVESVTMCKKIEWENVVDENYADDKDALSIIPESPMGEGGESIGKFQEGDVSSSRQRVNFEFG